MLDPQLQQRLIEEGRRFMKYSWQDEFGEFESDQDLKLPQPPLVKAAVQPKDEWIVLPRNFDALDLQVDLAHLFARRQSRRVYTQQPLSLLQLSWLLYASQGIKEIRGRQYATLRTVPSGGARHGFETYLLVKNVESLPSGAYHYLPMEHCLEFLHPIQDLDAVISRSLCGQDWAQKASVVFFWSNVAYRNEWRYGIYAHRVALIDAGHVDQNLYLAAEAVHLGTCAIAAFDGPAAARVFGLDDQEEYIVYTAPVGTIRQQDQPKETAFYAFLEETGL